VTIRDDDEFATAGVGAADVETLLRRVADLVGNARPMPLSASVMINRDEVLELVEEATERLPEELRQARWLLRERDEFLAKVQRQGDDILDQARVQAERMVQRTEVVRAAQHTARRTVEEAEAEARRLRHEAEDYCDQKLAQFEIVLDRTAKTVQAGRSRLQGTAAMTGEVPAVSAVVGEEQVDAASEAEFFDQDS
jgi:cell division septum initiation protein DivIVA